MEKLCSHWMDFHEFDIWAIFENLSQNSSFIKTWQEKRELYMKSNIHFWSSHIFLLRMTHVSHKSCTENWNTHLSSITIFQKYEIMWQNIVEPDRPQMTIWCMCSGRWILMTTDTPRICNTYCFSCNNGCMNSPQCYIYTYNAYRVIFILQIYHCTSMT
jgi:hypothetical protein